MTAGKMKPSGRSGFGDQHDSRKSTAPNFGFGSSVRDAIARQHISDEHAKATPPKGTPGAIYDLGSSVGTQSDSTRLTAPDHSFGSQRRLPPNYASYVSSPGPGSYKSTGAVGKQVDSDKATGAKYSFGSETREGTEKVFLSNDHQKADYGKGSPGPAVYNAKSSLATQVSSKNETAPAPLFGTGARLNYDHVRRAERLPGPGQYKATVSAGPQADSRKKTSAEFSFGTCKRAQRDMTYISPEHEKAWYGRGSPGPNTGNATTSLAKQVRSSKNSNPSWGFGTSKRFSHNKDALNTPGPDAYD